MPDIDWSIPTSKRPSECNYSEDVTTALLELIGDFSSSQLAREANHTHQTKVHCVRNILQLLLVSNPDAFSPVNTHPGIWIISS